MVASFGLPGRDTPARTRKSHVGNSCLNGNSLKRSCSLSLHLRDVAIALIDNFSSIFTPQVRIIRSTYSPVCGLATSWSTDCTYSCSPYSLFRNPLQRTTGRPFARFFPLVNPAPHSYRSLSGTTKIPPIPPRVSASDRQGHTLQSLVLISSIGVAVFLAELRPIISHPQPHIFYSETLEAALRHRLDPKRPSNGSRPVTQGALPSGAFIQNAAITDARQLSAAATTFATLFPTILLHEPTILPNDGVPTIRRRAAKVAGRARYGDLFGMAARSVPCFPSCC